MRRILVVDDNRMVRKTVEESLEIFGFDIEHADNGAVALSRLKQAPFDLVFLDINMPVLDGPSMLRIMRHMGITAKVVLLTSTGEMPVLASTIKLGTSDYISKPFTVETVHKTVSRLLQIDLSEIPRQRPRVLVQHEDERVAQALRSLLPEHVEVDFVSLLADCVDAAERNDYGLILLDCRILDGDVVTAADLLRARQPAAAIFSLEADAVEGDRRWKKSEALDGVLCSNFEEFPVHDFLYNHFVRPLVFTRGNLLYTSGFRGDAANLDIYFTQLRRILGVRAERRAKEEGEVFIDLQRVPQEVERLAQLIHDVQAHLTERGVAAAFKLSDPLRSTLAARADLGRTVLLPPSE